MPDIAIREATSVLDSLTVNLELFGNKLTSFGLWVRKKTEVGGSLKTFAEGLIREVLMA
jgi:hypothetical protein